MEKLTYHKIEFIKFILSESGFEFLKDNLFTQSMPTKIATLVAATDRTAIEMRRLHFPKNTEDTALVKGIVPTEKGDFEFIIRYSLPHEEGCYGALKSIKRQGWIQKKLLAYAPVGYRHP
ncbi:MAG TPA: hypothetical protein VJ942_15240 [Roseovarius sp.]|nr:hypothetical protein [Roseovarius sp.]